MAEAVRRLVLELPPAPAKTWTPVEASSEHAAVTPAPHQLWADLDRELGAGAAPAPEVLKWPPGLSLAFMLGSSALLWGAILLGLRALH